MPTHSPSQLKTRLAGALIGVSTSIATLAACSPPPTVYFGSSPAYLQSDIAPDTSVVIELGDRYQPSMPALQDDFPLIGPSGPVDATYTLARDGRLTITPDAPLEPGTYEVFGSLHPDGSGHYQEVTSFGQRHVADLQFTVGSAPSLLGATVLEDSDGLLLVFSEPVVADSIATRVEETLVQGVPGPEPTMVVLKHPDLERWELELEPGARSVTDEPVRIPGEVPGLSECTLTRIGGGACSER